MVVAVLSLALVSGRAPFVGSSDEIATTGVAGTTDPSVEGATGVAAGLAAEVAAEVERAGQQFDPVPTAASADPSAEARRSEEPADGDSTAAGVGVGGADRAGGAGVVGFPSVRSDAGIGAEGYGGSFALWPEWAICEFDDDRTSGPGVRSVVVDRDRQRSWFCEGTEVTHVFPVTTARSQPDPGVYEVYAKDMHTSSTFGGGYSTMTHFVAFTRGKFQGARVAFHSVPVYRDGSWVQPLESVGSPDRFGDSSGCIRALPADAEAIWDWLDVGDLVRVIT